MQGKIDVYGFNSTNYFSESTRPHYYDWERPQKGREKVQRHRFKNKMTPNQLKKRRESYAKNLDMNEKQRVLHQKNKHKIVTPDPPPNATFLARSMR